MASLCGLSASVSSSLHPARAAGETPLQAHFLRQRCGASTRRPTLGTTLDLRTSQWRAALPILATPWYRTLCYERGKMLILRVKRRAGQTCPPGRTARVSEPYARYKDTLGALSRRLVWPAFVPPPFHQSHPSIPYIAGRTWLHLSTPSCVFISSGSLFPEQSPNSHHMPFRNQRPTDRPSPLPQRSASLSGSEYGGSTTTSSSSSSSSSWLTT